MRLLGEMDGSSYLLHKICTQKTLTKPSIWQKNPQYADKCLMTDTTKICKEFSHDSRQLSNR